MAYAGHALSDLQNAQRGKGMGAKAGGWSASLRTLPDL
jgi:hypothetical protein